MTLISDLNSIIANTLIRQSVTSCSTYAAKYRVMKNGPWGFKYHPWLREMHDSNAPVNVGRKSAQMGFTECVLNRTFFHVDIKRTDCLYVLPAKTPDASDFSAARFDAAIQLSPHLTSLFSDVKNVGHKKAGAVNVYIRGSKSRGGLKSIPVGFMVLDELDEMDQEQVALAKERLSGQFEKQIWQISTPTLPKIKIDHEFALSTQESYFFHCPACSRSICLEPENLVVCGESADDPRVNESHTICLVCKNKLPSPIWPVLQEGVWVPKINGLNTRGFYINQLYSSTVSPVEIAIQVHRAATDPADEQELWNSKFGLPRTVKGARLTNDDITACVADYLEGPVGGIVTLGIDVGSFLHCVISEWRLPDRLCKDLNTHSQPRIVARLKLNQFEQLDAVMREYQVHFAVIDMMPERRKAKEFADRFDGYVRLCYYGRGITGKSIKETKDNEFTDDHMITVDRTSWMDHILNRFRKRSILLPKQQNTEYEDHLTNVVRVYSKDAEGNPVARYENIGPDHFTHATLYSEIALPFAMANATNSSVESFL